MTRTWLSLLGLSLFLSPACSGDASGSKRERCETEGEVRDCTCDDAQSGTQECSAKNAWSTCDCSVSPGDGDGDAALDPDSGAPDPRDAATSTDAGEQPEDSGALSDGSAGGGDSGNDSDSGEPVPPYASCTEDGDCNPGDMCRRFAVTGACAAPCQENTDCTAPDGTYEAEVLCGDDGHCRIDCAPTGVPPTARSCPSGMVCLGMGSNRNCFPSEL